MELARIKILKRMLLERRMDALRSSKSGMRRLLSGGNSEAFGAGLEEVDLPVALQNETVLCMQFNTQWELIRKIDHALRRLDEGTYGICEECKDEISGDRLSIIPFALYCRNCQEAKETERKVSLRRAGN